MCLPVNDAAAGPAFRCRTARSCAATNCIAAGVELLGGEAGPALTVRAVCRAAGLTERYFYESFTDRDEFVRAVYDDVCTRAMSTLTTADTPRDAVERFVALMVDDPTRGRVLLLAPGVEPVLTRSGAEWMPNFIDLLQHKLTRITDPGSPGHGGHRPDRRADGVVHRLSEWPPDGHPGAVHRLLRRHAAQPGVELLTATRRGRADLFERRFFFRLGLLFRGSLVGGGLRLRGPPGCPTRRLALVAVA